MTTVKLLVFHRLLFLTDADRGLHPNLRRLTDKLNGLLNFTQIDFFLPVLAQVVQPDLLLASHPLLLRMLLRARRCRTGKRARNEKIYGDFPAF